MSITRLDTPYLDGGIRSTNFFNGRILSREDMQREQDAERAVHERLGRAVGAGVVRGFQVEAKAIGGNSVKEPVVTVRAGLGVNAHGQTVALDRDVDVALLKPAKGATGGNPLAGSFDTCAPPESTVYVVGTGVYLLSVAPAQAKQGLAIVSGLGNGQSSCNVKEVVEGVQFRLFEVKLTPAEKADDAHLRNVAAYKFFAAGGPGTGTAAVRDPFGLPDPVPTLTDPPLTDCDLPLALFQWTATGGLRWVDLWSVRRRVAHASTGEAMIRQFREHLADLAPAAPAGFRAKDAFVRLPPLGLVPVRRASAAGFDIDAFFTGFTRRPVPAFIEGAKLASLYDDAARYPPIEVGGKEAVWTYFVRENLRAVDLGGPGAPQPYLVFSNGQVPYRGNARFDLAYWSYANFALGGEERT